MVGSRMKCVTLRWPSITEGFDGVISNTTSDIFDNAIKFYDGDDDDDDKDSRD